MKSSHDEILPIFGAAMGGGFYAGRIQIDGKPFALITAPKADEVASSIWIARYKAVPGAHSYCNGLANTKAMAESGSKLARSILDLRVGGFDDWYLPALDELELCYRNLKPGAGQNHCWARSGISLNSMPPGQPYTPTFPAQTLDEAFHEGATEAFDLDAYWSSTQHASGSGYAWTQDFANGVQGYWSTDVKLRARPVRRIQIGD